MNDEFQTTKEIAKQLDLAPTTVRVHCHALKDEGLIISGSIRIHYRCYQSNSSNIATAWKLKTGE